MYLFDKNINQLYIIKV